MIEFLFTMMLLAADNDGWQIERSTLNRPLGGIADAVRCALDRTTVRSGLSLDEILETDREAREHARAWVKENRA